MNLSIIEEIILSGYIGDETMLTEKQQKEVNEWNNKSLEQHYRPIILGKQGISKHEQT